MIHEIYYIVALNILFFCSGLYLGKIFNSQQNTIGLVNKKNNKQINQNNALNLSIDETKVVTKINTDNLEKKYTNIGEETKTQDNISSAVNKLKNMKG